MRVHVVSRPSRGAWIETVPRGQAARAMRCRALHGARGLKQPGFPNAVLDVRVAPFTGRVD